MITRNRSRHEVDCCVFPAGDEPRQLEKKGLSQERSEHARLRLRPDGNEREIHEPSAFRAAATETT